MIKLATIPMGVPYYKRNEFYLGLSLAIISSFFVGSSFIIKKFSLIRLTRTGNVRAGAGGFGYLRDWLWWLGLLMMGLGEAANLGAYAYAPASQITPLGALSILVSTLLSAKYFNERLNIFGKIGSLLCIIGSTVLVLHAPKDDRVVTWKALVEKLEETSFVNYVLIIIVYLCLVIVYLGPRYGSKNVMIYLTLCSTIGSLTVMICKAIAIITKDCLRPNPPCEMQPALISILGLAVTAVICICVQMMYLNKALDLFDTNIVTPIYYIMFTTCVMVASSILFKEWELLSGEAVFGTISGFVILIVAIYMLTYFKDLDVISRYSQAVPKYY